MTRPFRSKPKALGFAALLLLMGCQTSSSGSSGNATAPVAMTPAAAPSEHAGMNHGDMNSSGSDSMNHDALKPGTRGLDALKALHGKEFDIAFLSQMIAHHQAAVEMAKQALSNAKRPETKADAQRVIDAQTQEIKQMTGWLQEWYQTTPSADQQSLARDDMKAMMSMPVSDDHMYFDMMTPHHQGAIDMSQLADERAARPEVKDLARKIITAQQAEIQKYQEMNH